MPDGPLRFLERAALLSFEEITRVVTVLAAHGVHDVRLTGGEPLLRRDLVALVQRLASIDDVKDLSLTTNGILLSKFAAGLKQAGLQRLNISLDALDEATFQSVARRPGLQQVLDGIQAAIDVGFTGIKLNAIALRGLTEPQVSRCCSLHSIASSCCGSSNTCRWMQIRNGSSRKCSAALRF